MEKSVNDTIARLNYRDFSIGNDVVFLPDFTLSFNDLFQKKAYSVAEIEYCQLFDQPILRFASTWAAKEAVYKAVKQLVPKRLGFKKIVISRSKTGGIPTVKLPSDFAELEISLSITHDGDYIWAVAIARKV